MKQAKISDLKNQLSRYLDLVRKGEIIQIQDRDVPIALIIPLSEADRKIRSSRLREMERKGLVRIGEQAALKELLNTPPPGKKTGVLKALLDERDEAL